MAPATAQDTIVVAPGAAKTGANGSAQHPFPSLSAAVDAGAVRPGGQVILAPGHHGHVRLHNRRFDPAITVTAAEGAHADQVSLRNSGGLIFRDLAVWPREPGPDIPALVHADKRSSDVHFHNLDIRGRADATAYASWGLDDWKGSLVNGVRLNGPDQSISDSRLLGLNFGIQTTGPDALVARNYIAGFAGDGMRGLGDRSVFTDNHVTDCVEFNSNHDDGFQSWSTARGDAGRSVTGLVIEGNTIVEWQGNADHPLRCTLQGIGLFDGPYFDTVIRNNIILIGAYHGIAIYGGQGNIIAHNTVLPVNGAPGNRSWIGMFPLKKSIKGPPSENNRIINNVSGHYVAKSGAGVVNNVPRDNGIVAYPLRTFPEFLSAPPLQALQPTDSNGLRDRARPGQTHGGRDIQGYTRNGESGADLGAIEAR